MSRPALPFALAFLAGVATSSATGCEPPGLLHGSAALLLAALVCRRRRSAAIGVGLLALFTAGAAVESGARIERRELAEGLLPRRGVSREAELVGRVARLPEPAAEGERFLLLRGATVSGRAGEGPYRVRLRVAAGSPASRRAVDALRSGDVVRVWCALRRPRGPGNPGSGDPASYLRAHGLHAVGRVKSVLLVERLERGSRWPRCWIDRWKLQARRRLDAMLDRDRDLRALGGAILLGDRLALGPELQRELRRGGLIHLVAISGLHLGLLAGISLNLLRRARTPAWVLLATALAALPVFALAVGPRPPVARAALAVGVALLGRCIGREGDAVNTLALAGCALVLWRPALVEDAGFQLTFVATAGILLHARSWARALPIPAVPATGLAVSAAAYLSAAPIIALRFGWLAPVALVSNLFAAPLCAAILLSGYAAIALEPVPLLCDALAGCCSLALEALLGVAGFASRFDGAGWRVGPPAALCVLAHYAALLGLRWVHGGPARRACLRGLLAFTVVLIHVGRPPAAGKGFSRVAVIDVGQGQAVALHGPDGSAVLVDAAGAPGLSFDPGERTVVPYLFRHGVPRLETLVISHGDADHMQGAFAVLREMEVGELWLAPGSHRHPGLIRLRALARRLGVALVLAERGGDYTRGGLRLRILGPGREDAELEGNDRSVVLLAGEAPLRVLIPGDLERAGERALLRRRAPPRAEALVVSHHGAGDGSGGEFLEHVRPEHAIVSCGFANRFGHPHVETLDRLKSRGARVWRTDRDGRVLLEGEAGRWRGRPFREETTFRDRRPATEPE